MDYLNDTIFEHKISLNQKLSINKAGRYFYINVDEDTADEIRDWAIGQLQLKGFDTNYELTKEGEVLEELSDIFYVYR